tara:strand:- start:2558 stop:3604 length:1047 start_codon:yes stop_codon:yes gene_type:complete
MINSIKTFRKYCLKIEKDIKRILQNENYIKIIINDLIILNLKIEKILFKNSKINPINTAYLEVKKIENKIKDLESIEVFVKKKLAKNNKFELEKNHKFLFENLWNKYSFDEYLKERIGRYKKRIKINKLNKILKNSKCIDSGCGHGNFLISCLLSGADYGFGLDYGNKSIEFAKKIQRKLKIPSKKLKYEIGSCYNIKAPSNYFDFGIQNGVFHHLENEDKAYEEIKRVIKKDGYLWIYTDGGGGIRDIVWDMCQRSLSETNNTMKLDIINNFGLTTNKQYHLSDGLNAKYRHTTYEDMIKRLKFYGFYNFKKLKGGFPTDYDETSIKDHYFKEKFGSGDIRILCQKK